MIKSNFLKFALALGVGITSLSSCVQKDEWTVPPITCTNRFAAPTKTIKQMIALVPATGSYTIPNGPTDPEIIVDGYVISSDENGNFYKTISFQDAASNPTAGLQIEVDKSSNYADLPVGAHIRIRANGLVIALDRGTYKLGSVDPTYAVGRIPQALESKYISGVCNGQGLDVQTIVPKKLNSLNDAKDPAYINTLVTVPNVMFADSDLGKNFVDISNGALVDTDRTLVDLGGGTATLRNSAFFSGGRTAIPGGFGDITFVVSRYNTSWQMLIRSLNDIQFTKARPTQLFKDGFDNGLANWTALSVTGTQVWNIQQFGNPKPCVVMSGNQSGTNYENLDYLISNPITIPNTYTGAILSFESDGRFGNPGTLETLITDNYNASNPAATIWTVLPATYDTDLTKFGPFVGSGPVNLNAYVGKTVRIAFRYTSTTASATTWEVDNVAITGLK